MPSSLGTALQNLENGIELIGIAAVPKAVASSTVAETQPGYTSGQLENTMPQLDTPEQDKQYLIDVGFTEESTGGGFSAMFLERDVASGRWNVMVTDWETDTAQLRPGRPFGIALHGPNEGKEELFEVFPELSKLPETIARFTREGEVRFGAGTKVR
jgi:hypothetical protein